MPGALPEASCIGRMSDRSGTSRAEVSSARVLHRTCRLPLVPMASEQWSQVRRIAFLCANFGNHLLTESYAKAKGLNGLHPYIDYRDLLSAAVRDAVSRECVGVWRRMGRRILRGEQTLARFAADRALVVRENGVVLERNADGQLALRVRLQPQSQGPATVFAIRTEVLRRDRWLGDIVEKLEAGTYRLTKLTFAFQRPGRKVTAIVSFVRPAASSSHGCKEAAFEYSNGHCRLYCDGTAISFDDAVHRMSVMKQHFAGIHSRLRKDLGKKGRMRVLRRAFLKAGNFDDWARGPLHQLSHHIVEWCRRNDVGVIRWTVDQTGDLPWARLAGFVQYKAEEAGIAFFVTGTESSGVGRSQPSAADAAPQIPGVLASEKSDELRGSYAGSR